MKEREGYTWEKSLVLESLTQNTRIDHRDFFDFRQIHVSTGPSLGQVTVKLGHTRVFVNVSCEIVRPSIGNPTEGSIVFNTEYLPMASESLDMDKQQEMEISLSRILEKTLWKSRALDTEGLCIVAGEKVMIFNKVWSIKVDIRILDNDGNLLDCACLAAMISLLHFKRPEVSVDGEEVVVYGADEKSPIPLSIHHIPVCITFAFYGDGKMIIVDPSLKEELAQEGEMTIALNMHREICTISKQGSVGVEMDALMKCATIAATKVAQLTNIIKEYLKQE